RPGPGHPRLADSPGTPGQERPHPTASATGIVLLGTVAGRYLQISLSRCSLAGVRRSVPLSFQENPVMKKHLLLPVLAILLVAGATAWAVSDRDPTVARDKGPVRVDGLDTPPPGIGPPRPPGGAPMPGGGLQPPGGPPPGGGGPRPPMGFGGGAPGQPPFPPGGGGTKIDYKELIPTLIAALDDDDGDVRKAVAVTLTRIGQPAVDPLLGVLKDKDKSKASRANAAYVLGRIGSPAREAL